MPASRRSRLPFIVPALLGACLAHPFEPAGALPVAPDSVYAVWWQRMEACAGLAAPLDRIEWYEVPGDEFSTPEGPRWGWWSPPHTIYVAEAHRLDEELVEHEMLHDLLQSGEHPPVFATCGVGFAEQVAARLPRAEMQWNDRGAPVQVQHRRIRSDDREVVGEDLHVAPLHRDRRHPQHVE